EAVQAQLKTLEASESTVDAASSAGEELAGKIRTKMQATKDAIKTLFTRYNEEIQAAVNNDSSLNGSVYVNANTEISGSSGLKGTFENVLDATTDLNTALTAYDTFSSGVHALVDTALPDADDATVNGYSNLLVATNIAN
ncbi:MAG TPA: hypothetical protein VK106_04250, partial [Balneolaceae bacterium]|nr:hypothetical protein [Balneolaceae bacterium]